MAVIEAHALAKRFGSTWALAGLDLTIAEGKIVGLLGPNGSGKSTLLKLITGLYRPTSGEITLNGREPSRETKAQVAYLPEIDYLYGWMSVGQTLDYVGSFYRDWSAKRAQELLEFMNLKRETKVGRLSKGMRARLKIVLAMARSAEVVLLDEPLSGIDPPSRSRILKAIVSEYRAGSQTIVISTHDISETESLFEDVVFLKEGKAVLQGDAEALRMEKAKSIRDVFEEVYS